MGSGIGYYLGIVGFGFISWNILLIPSAIGFIAGVVYAVKTA